jgi:hypothetical protein
VVLLVSSWPVWSCFARLCVGFFFLAGCVLGMFLFQGLEKSLRLSGTLIVRLLQPPAWPALSTSLTDVTVWPAQDIDLTSVAQAVSRASFRCVCSWVLARKAVCWFLGPVALQWLRGFNQLGSWVGDMCGKSCSSCWSLYLHREEFLSARIPSPLWFAVSVLQLWTWMEKSEASFVMIGMCYFSVFQRIIVVSFKKILEYEFYIWSVC